MSGIDLDTGCTGLHGKCERIQMLKQLNCSRIAEVGIVLPTHGNSFEAVFRVVGVAVDPSLELPLGHAHSVR